MMFVVYRLSTGEAVSIGSKVATPLPAGLTAVALSDSDSADLLAGVKVWDAATLQLIAAPTPAAEQTPEEKLAAARTVLDQIASLPAPVLTADVVDLLDDLRTVL